MALGQRLRPALQGLCIAAIPALTVVDVLQRQRASVALLAGACLVFLLLQQRHAATAVRRTCFALIAVTALLLPVIDTPLQALEKGVRIGALIAAILISVGLLSRASLRVPRMRKLVDRLYALPRARRPLALAIAAQFLGGFLGLAGLTLMMDMASRRSGIPPAEQIADFSAISRGYAALSVWSPMYSNMSIVLALYGGVLWSDVLPFALGISAVFIGLGALLERLARRGAAAEKAPAGSVAALLREGLPIVAVMLGFFMLMVLASDYLQVSISAAIIVGAPVVAWLLNAMHPCDPAQRWRSSCRHLGQDLTGQSVMAGEVMLFLASGCAGTVIAQAIPAAWTAGLAQMTGGSPYLGCLLVMAAIVTLSGTSIHPMLSALLVGSSLSPGLLGLPVWVHVCAVLIGWGLAIIVTPFSVISLMAARFSGIPLLVISLRANLVYVLVCMGSAALVLGAAASMLPGS